MPIRKFRVKSMSYKMQHYLLMKIVKLSDADTGYKASY